MREIRGWQIGEVVTASDLTLDSANVYEQIGSDGEANLPCIYNGLTLQSQAGTGNSIVTFNPGVARCQDLPTSVYTYLPTNVYGTSYPCFIDISVLDSNTVITLTTTPSPGYIVATFSISPNTSAQTNYVITGSLLQIAIGSYNPAIHVRLCQYTYTGSTFVLDFTPKTHRDTDMTGLGGIQWNYQNSSLILDIPTSQSGSAIVMNQNLIASQNLTVQGTALIQSGDSLQFYNAANTHFTAFQAGSNTSDVTFALPIVDGTPGQALTTNGSKVLSFTSVGLSGNIAANDSNVIFTNTSNPYQICNPTAPRTYTLPSNLTPGIPWTFYNQATSSMNYITLQTSGSNAICIVPPLGYAIIVPTSSTPTAKANWFLQDRQSQWVFVSPILLYMGLGSTVGNSAVSRMVNDSIIVRAGVTTGTTTAVIATVNIPYGLIIDINKIAVSNTVGNPGSVVGTWEQDAANSAGSIIVETTTTTSSLYYGASYNASGGLTPQNGGVYIGNSALLITNYSIPVTL